ncbi:hypothetical protein [Nocardia tengchongensis]
MRGASNRRARSIALSLLIEFLPRCGFRRSSQHFDEVAPGRREGQARQVGPDAVERGLHLRDLKINELHTITADVVETARSTLVIGAT